MELSWVHTTTTRTRLLQTHSLHWVRFGFKLPDMSILQLKTSLVNWDCWVEKGLMMQSRTTEIGVFVASLASVQETTISAQELTCVRL